jgi:hypothetical protein
MLRFRPSVGGDSCTLDAGTDTQGRNGMETIFGLLILILNIIAIVSVVMGTSPPARKVLWVVIILLLPVIGVILYFLIGRSPRDA